MEQQPHNQPQPKKDWLEREAQGDGELRQLLDEREALSDQMADGGMTWAERDAVKHDLGHITALVTARKSEIGIDQPSFSPPYDIEGLDDELKLVQDTATRHRRKGRLA